MKALLLCAATLLVAGVSAFGQIPGRVDARNRLAWKIVLAVGLVMLVAAPRVGASQAVKARDRSIYLIRADGSERRLTDSGQDSDPSLSADERTIVYVRSQPSATAGDEGVVSEIRVQSVATGTEEGILKGPVVIDGKEHYAFGAPWFSLDGKTVYFLFDWAVVTHGLAGVDLATRRVKFMMPAFDFAGVVPYGEYAGDLVVLQNRLTLSVGRYRLYYCFTPGGKEIGVVGENSFQVGLFMDPDGRQ